MLCGTAFGMGETYGIACRTRVPYGDVLPSAYHLLRMSFATRLCVVLTVLLVFSFGTAHAQSVPFDVPWVGYNVGTSAYLGNPEPYERDPYAIASADFDGDGDVDVVVANYDYAAPGGTDGSSGFALLFNAGDGTYGEAVHYTFTDKGSFDVVVGDFDEDGHPDLALPNAGQITGEHGNTVVVFLNDGTGAFAQAGEFLVTERPRTLAVGDFDGDGHLDLVADSYRFSSEHLAVLFGTGTGSFGPRVLVPVGDFTQGVSAADLDGDGSDDIMTSVFGDLFVAMSDGSGGFLAPVMVADGGGALPIVGHIAAADLNNDGVLDLVHGVYQSSATGGEHVEQEVVVRLGLGGGAFGPPSYYSIGDYVTAPEAVVPADLNGDGWIDVVTCDWSGRTGDGIMILLNDGTGGLLPAQRVPAGQGTQDIAVADVDGNGTLDVLSADRMSLAVTVHKNSGDGWLPVLQTRYPASSDDLQLVLADVDHDGDLDAFTSGEAFGSSGALLKNRGDGTFAAPVFYTHSDDYGRGVSRAKLRDLDGDGFVDLLYNDPHTDFQNGYNYYSALNDGTGAFGPIVEWPVGSCGMGDVDAVDLDNDGDLDVVNLEELNCAGADFGNRIIISIGHGDGTFGPPVPITVAQFPTTLGHGDFDEDGNVDLVTAHWGAYGSSRIVQLHLGNGDGTLQEEQTYEVGQGPRYLVVADLNGDGHLDVATANSGSDDLRTKQETMTVLLGTGDGAFFSRVDHYAPYSPDLLGATGIEAGDVDADGDLDLMMTTVANGAAMYENDGAGAFAFTRRIGLYSGPWSPVFADVNGDAVPDLAVLTSVLPSGIGRDLAILPAHADAPVAAEPNTPGGAALPDGFALGAAYPNPFSTYARVSLEVAEAQPVRVEVFDALGRRMAVLHDGPLAAEAHTLTFDGAGLPSGVYIVRVVGERFSEARRVVLVR